MKRVKYCSAAGIDDGKLRDCPSYRDAPDLAAVELGKPEVAIGSSRDAPWTAIRWRKAKFGDGPVCCDASNLVGIQFRKPEIAIRSSCDALWIAR